MCDSGNCVIRRQATKFRSSLVVHTQSTKKHSALQITQLTGPGRITDPMLKVCVQLYLLINYELKLKRKFKI